MDDVCAAVDAVSLEVADVGCEVDVDVDADADAGAGAGAGTSAAP
jgi:hypothetical protein